MSRARASRQGAGASPWLRGLLVLTVIGLAGAGVYVLSARAPSDLEEGSPEAPSPAGAASSGSAASEATSAADTEKPLPEGALGPILTDPDPNRIPFCDDRNWPRVHEVVRAVGPAEPSAGVAGVVSVDETVWPALARGARRGIASWASRCELAGGSVIVRGAESGADLGRYDGASGFFSEPDAGS